MSARAAWAKRIGAAGARPHKYGARATVVDGLRFDSTREARRYRELVLLEKARQISRLETQPVFLIDVVQLFRLLTGAPLDQCVSTCGVYTADFRYVTAAGELVVEDVKSGPTKTTAYRLRKKLVEAIHGITIREI